MAAAVTAAQAGHRVTVFEASRSLGGRARAIHGQRANGQAAILDNGQHILIGAYRECLRLMHIVGVDPEDALLRQPLALVFPDGTGLALPDAPPPWDALAGIARARGWTLSERAALLAVAFRWRRTGFRCAAHATVADLCAGLPERLMREFIEPLCVSALNTPVHMACGTTFLRVLQDSLLGERGGSHLLLPRWDMSALFPDPAADWLRWYGHTVHTKRRVQQIAPSSTTAPHRWEVDGAPFDAVVLACNSTEAARLVAPLDLPGASQWASTAAALEFGAIATVYTTTSKAPTSPSGPLLPRPMLALRSSSTHPAQCVFDRGQLGGPCGILAFVVSAFTGTRQTLEAQVLAQAAHDLHLHDLQVMQTVIEKRATFVCTPQLARPPMQIAAGLWACGDYVAGPYPATLEGAVLHGKAVAQQLI